MDTIDRLCSILEVLNSALAGTYGDIDDDYVIRQMFASSKDAEIAMLMDAIEDARYELDDVIRELTDIQLGDDNNG